MLRAPKSAAWPRATWPTRWTCRSATPWTSGPRPRCSPPHGYTALVYGPGDIAQAHTADEFVTLEQLQRYADSVHRIINGSR